MTTDAVTVPDAPVAAARAVSLPSDRSRLGLAVFMVGAGIMHFVAPRFYEQIVPRWIGHEKQVVAWSGVAEVLCGALVAVPRTRRLGAWLTLVTLVAVYPANVQMAIDSGKPHDAMSWGAWLRLPLQLPMWRWAWKHTR